MKKLLLQIVMAVRQFYWRIVKPVTMGVRAILVDPGGKILLVQHSYSKGWFLPGGKVKKGESLEAAIKRELREELGVTEIAQMVKFAEYKNNAEHKKDTVIVFVVKDFKIVPKKHFEITRWNFFDVDVLPKEISPGTLRRIQEWAGCNPIREQW